MISNEEKLKSLESQVRAGEVAEKLSLRYMDMKDSEIAEDIYSNAHDKVVSTSEEFSSFELMYEITRILRGLVDTQVLSISRAMDVKAELKAKVDKGLQFVKEQNYKRGVKDGITKAMEMICTMQEDALIDMKEHKKTFFKEVYTNGDK